MLPEEAVYRLACMFFICRLRDGALKEVFEILTESYNCQQEQQAYVPKPQRSRYITVDGTDRVQGRPFSLSAE